MLRSCWEKRAWSPKSQWYRQPNCVFNCRSRSFISGGSALATSAAPTVAPAVTSAPTTLRRSTFFIVGPPVDASLARQAAQPDLSLRCLELQCALVPALRFRRAGLAAAHMPTRELVRILGLGHLHRRDGEPQIGGADVELARNSNVALRDMAIAQLDEPLRTVEVFRGRGLAA